MKDLSFNTINAELVCETIDQINKDLFETKQCVLHNVHEKTMYENTIAQLKTILSKLKTTELQAFLYKVDIKEETLKQILRKSGSNYYMELSKLILEREFKKVYLRKYFASKS